MELNAINAPSWPISFLQSLARYVYRTGNTLSKGDHMPLNNILGGEGNKTALLFTLDSQLHSELKNPLGTFQFIQVGFYRNAQGNVKETSYYYFIREFFIIFLIFFNFFVIILILFLGSWNYR